MARAYESTSGVLEEVEKSIVKNSRPLLQMRISRQRREFGQDGVNFTDKDAAEYSHECKTATKGITVSRHPKKVLEDGFQAAHQIKQIQT